MALTFAAMVNVKPTTFMPELNEISISLVVVV